MTPMLILIFFLSILIFKCMCVLDVCMWTTCMPCAWGGQNRVPTLLVLMIKPRSSARASSTFNHWAKSAALIAFMAFCPLTMCSCSTEQKLPLLFTPLTVWMNSLSRTQQNSPMLTGSLLQRFSSGGNFASPRHCMCYVIYQWATPRRNNRI